jgi:molybdopterin/thiamine biosynthesis adenylyltransferase
VDSLFYLRNPQEREALAGNHISIVGCGSFGSALADILVRAGVEKLTLIDPEVLSVENIGRHVLTSRDLCKAKVHALAERLREVNPELQVEARQERFSDAGGLLICCADSRRCESLVNAVSLQKQLPAIYVGAYGAVRAGEIQFCVPGQTACRECFASFREIDEAVLPRPERYTDPDFDETRTHGQRGLWGSVLAVSGIAFHGILALLGVRGRLDLDHPLWIVNLDYDGFQPYAVTFCKVRRGCAVCDETKITELRIDDPLGR